ncbi:MAG: ABC transporter substrate-binding protein [Pseudomonadota bacterium]
MAYDALCRPVLAAALWLAAVPGLAAERVVSLNLCTDQLLVLLADRTQIASLSFLAADPDLSYVADRIDGIPLNHGALEEILPLGPNLVLAGAFAARPAVRLLQAQEVPVIDLPLADDFATIAEQTRMVAEAIGQEERGEELVAEMTAILADARAANAQGPDRTALAYQANGFTAGSDTLTDAVLTEAGYRNAAAEAGLAGYGFLPLEQLVARPPDVLIAPATLPGRPSLAEALLVHPALAALDDRVDRLAIPSALLACGGPFTAQAVAALAAVEP